MHTAVHRVAALLVHLDRFRIRRTHKQIHKVRVVHTLRDQLEKVHQHLRHAKPPELGCDRDRGDVPV